MLFCLIISGLVLGSFLNVLIYRLPRGESIVWPGSHCVTCGHQLGILDLVPLVSYMSLRGRCRYCGKKISRQYPLIEIATAVLWVLVYAQYGLSMVTLVGCIFAAILLVAAFTDINEGIIPDRLTYPGILLGITSAYFTMGLQTAILGAVVFLAVFLFIALVSRGGMGGGDIKLAAVIGAFVGLKGILPVFIISSVLGGIWALILLVRGQAERKTAIKFGPFMSLAAFLVYVWGQDLILLYLSWF